jgi:hypothetical protein
MTEITVRGWEEFENRIRELRRDLSSNSSPLVFRGQGDSAWQLTTTLERQGEDAMRFADYHRLITTVKPTIESLTNVTWNVTEYGFEFEQYLSEYDTFSNFPSEDVYRYMVYLRHQGFPSPLLDWSHSPCVAAFFAFRDAHPNVQTRSIFVFCERPTGFKTSGSGEPTIRRIGPYVRTHRRHFHQQSDYTICGDYFKDGWRYSPHDRVFAREAPDQDVLWKFNIPASERLDVLRRLNDFNLNAFSLFDSEESLMETMWLRERVLKSKRVSPPAAQSQSDQMCAEPARIDRNRCPR